MKNIASIVGVKSVTSMHNNVYI